MNMRGFGVIMAMAFVWMLNGCTISRMVVYNFSDIRDYKKFPSRELPKSEKPFYFSHPADPDYFIRKNIRIRHDDRLMAIDSVLPETKTVAFLVIRNDSLLYERYFDGYSKESWVASFSMAKSYTSALIGAAIAEGKINNIEEPITNYLPELLKTDLKDVKIRHLLEMTAQIKHAENYFNPFAGVARLYYGKHLPRQISKLKHDAPVGSDFQYQSVATQMLGEIVVRATGKDLTEYLNQQIWQHLGTEYPASWSIDQKKNGREKAFCGINATARDFAKFGRLFMNRGNWDGRQILPAEWVDASVRVNEAEGSAWFYGYQWWIISKKSDYAAEGHMGQYIYVNPEHNIIIVRLGKGYGKTRWTQVFGEIITQLQP